LSIERVERAANTTTTAIQHVRVDHGGADVAMAQQFLDGSNVVAGLEQVGGERVTKCVAGRRSRQTSVLAGALDRFLQH
jgi:hypothetical protein